MNSQISKARFSNASITRPIYGRLSLLAISLTVGLVFSVPCYAQYFGTGTSTLTDPLISGAPNTVSGVPASSGAPPPIGSGAVPLPVNPGMLGPSTLLPWVPLIPADQIDQSSSRINLGAGPATLSPPGVLGPSLTVPPPPSTPGSDPGSLSSPSSAAQVQVNSGGGLPPGAAPLNRRSGQKTQDFGSSRTSGSQTVDLGNKPTNSYGSLQESEDGPRNSTYPGSKPVNHTPYLNNSQETSDLYGIPIQSPSGQPATQTIANY
jgi:hypothetical protein